MQVFCHFGPLLQSAGSISGITKKTARPNGKVDRFGQPSGGPNKDELQTKFWSLDLPSLAVSLPLIFMTLIGKPMKNIIIITSFTIMTFALYDGTVSRANAQTTGTDQVCADISGIAGGSNRIAVANQAIRNLMKNVTNQSIKGWRRFGPQRRVRCTRNSGRYTCHVTRKMCNNT